MSAHNHSPKPTPKPTHHNTANHPPSFSNPKPPFEQHPNNNTGAKSQQQIPNPATANKPPPSPNPQSRYSSPAISPAPTQHHQNNNNPIQPNTTPTNPPPNPPHSNIPKQTNTHQLSLQSQQQLSQNNVLAITKPPAHSASAFSHLQQQSNPKSHTPDAASGTYQTSYLGALNNTNPATQQ